MPRRTAQSDRQRDQELLSQIPSVSREQVERDLAAIKIKREEEMGSGGSSTDKRARCKRNGRDIDLPVRTSATVRERDQDLLDSIDVGLSEEALDLRVAEIKAQRAREIVTGLLESSPGAAQGKKRRKRARPIPFLQEQASLQESFVKGEHVRMVVDALSHEAMTCFRLTGPFTEYSLRSPNNVNVFPGFRNFGNTCWLNATLQCLLHTVPIRTHLLRESELISAIEVALKRICNCYWALSSAPRHSVIAPVDLLTALILEQPQLGGALQQDVGDVLLLFRLGDVAGIAEFQEQACNLCIQGVTLVKLEVDDLQKSNMSLQELWDCTIPAWEMLATLPSFWSSFTQMYSKCPKVAFVILSWSLRT